MIIRIVYVNNPKIGENQSAKWVGFRSDLQMDIEIVICWSGMNCTQATSIIHHDIEPINLLFDDQNKKSVKKKKQSGIEHVSVSASEHESESEKSPSVALSIAKSRSKKSRTHHSSKAVRRSKYHDRRQSWHRRHHHGRHGKSRDRKSERSESGVSDARAKSTKSTKPKTDKKKRAPRKKKEKGPFILQPSPHIPPDQLTDMQKSIFSNVRINTPHHLWEQEGNPQFPTQSVNKYLGTAKIFNRTWFESTHNVTAPQTFKWIWKISDIKCMADPLMKWNLKYCNVQGWKITLNIPAPLARLID